MCILVVLSTQRHPRSSAAVATTSSESTKSPSTGGYGGLLWGNYDEEVSAKSFQEAIQAWRDSGKETTGSVAGTTTPGKTSREVQVGVALGGLVGMTQLKSCDGILNERSSSLNYMEQMLLRKMRTNTPPVPQATAMLSECDRSLDGLDVDAAHGSQITGGYLFDVSSVDELPPFSHGIRHCLEEELIVTEVSDSELVELDGTRPSSEAIIDEGSNDSSGADQEETVPVDPSVLTIENSLSADSRNLTDENTSENHNEGSVEKSTGQSSKKSGKRKTVSRQTKSRGKKRDRVEENERAEASERKQQTGIAGSVPVPWTHSRPYSGLGGFFLAAVDGDELEGDELEAGKNSASDDATVESADASLLFTSATMWNPLASQVDASSEGSCVDITNHVNPVLSEVSLQGNSDSGDDNDDESLPVYLRPSSVLQNVGLDEINHEEDEEDMKTLDDLALELQSLSRLEEQDQRPSVVSMSDSEATDKMDEDSVLVDSPGQLARHLDIDTLMDDFEEMESKIMQGHECQ